MRVYSRSYSRAGLQPPPLARQSSFGARARRPRPAPRRWRAFGSLKIDAEASSEEGFFYLEEKNTSSFATAAQLNGAPAPAPAPSSSRDSASPAFVQNPPLFVCWRVATTCVSSPPLTTTSGATAGYEWRRFLTVEERQGVREKIRAAYVSNCASCETASLPVDLKKSG